MVDIEESDDEDASRATARSPSPLRTETSSRADTARTNMGICKPHWARSQNVKDKKAEKRMAELKRRCEAAGKVWVDPIDKEEHRNKERLAMLVPTTKEAAEELKGRPPLEIIEANMRELSEKRFTKAEQMERMRFVDSLFAPQFKAMPRDKTTIDEAHHMMLERVGEDELRCRLCGGKQVWGGKWASHDTHCQSETHKMRCWEQAACNEMVGAAKSARRFEPTPGLMGPLTYSRFREYWGQEIHQMEQLVWDRLKKGTKLAVDQPHWGKKSKIELSATNLTSVHFGAVPYGGSGKYLEDGSTYFVPFERFERLIEDDHQKEAIRSPLNKGFWPVCEVRWKNMHLDHGYTSEADYEVAVKAGRCKVYVVCWYQLLDSGAIMAVWAINYVQE